jgi:predicted glutamine amidotransferase
MHKRQVMQVATGIGASARIDFDGIATALTRMFRTAEAICDDASEGKRSAMNFLVTDGTRFFCTRRDRSLFVTASPTLAAIASTELPIDAAQWREVPQDTLVTIDEELVLKLATLSP